MILKVLTQLNWVDVFLILLFCRVCYIAVKAGFIAEFFKFLGTVAAMYCALHYYIALSEWSIRMLAVDKNRMPVHFVEFLCFLVLAIGTYVLVGIVRNMFTSAVKMEAVATLEKWGGLLLGSVRGILLCSLICFALVISTVDYLRVSVRSSYLGDRIVGVVGRAYTFIWDSFASRFMVNEKLNEAVKK